MPLLLSIISFVATTTGMYYYKNKLAVVTTEQLEMSLKRKCLFWCLPRMTRKEVRLTILHPPVPAMVMSSYALLLNIIPAPK